MFFNLINIFIILIIYFIININSEPFYDNLESSDLCGRGTYKLNLYDSSGKIVGKNRNCQKCPRGTYGSTIGLTNKVCTNYCPYGKYNDILGAQTIDDCKLCPVGTYGSAVGLKSDSCSGKCPVGKFSRTEGLTSVGQCITCEPQFWQCMKYYNSFLQEVDPIKVESSRVRGS